MNPFGIKIFFILIFATCIFDAQAQANFSSNLPIVIINSGGQIQDEKNIARMGIIDNGSGQTNNTSDPFNDYDGFVGIETRGSSSQSFPKKSFGFAIWTESGEDSVASILGMPEEEDWILYAPYTDKSLMRNVLTFKITNEMGRYGSRTRYCEVVLNGSYEGVYVMMEKVKRDKNRVALNKLNPEEIEGENLTGGYLIKIDKTTGTNSNEGWHSSIQNSNNKNTYFQYEYPKIKNIMPEQRQYIQDYIKGFETALAGDNFQDNGSGYKTWAEMESFIDFSIVNEITKNVDGYRLSTFMHKDKNGKLIMGPVWDFNLAFGNADYCEGGNTYGWAWNFNKICPDDGFQIPFWWKRLLQDEVYVQAYINRWTDLRMDVLKTENLHASIDSMAVVLNQSQKRNYDKWQILGNYVWPNAYVGANFADEVKYLKRWIADRTEWMDNNIGKLITIASIRGQNDLSNSLSIYPNPFENELFIKYKNTTKEPLTIELHDIYGKRLFQSHSISRGNNQDFRVKISELLGTEISSGIYFLKVVDLKGNSESYKIIKK
ncbi:MAG: CotH kinase family protein [Bacteroidota bacterium]|nr:CotH kinase family protein [Bacteroidota bacterium]